MRRTGACCLPAPFALLLGHVEASLGGETIHPYRMNAAALREAKGFRVVMDLSRDDGRIVRQ